MFGNNNDSCYYCSSANLIKRGGWGISGQRFKCKSCKKTFIDNPIKRKYSYDERKRIVDFSKSHGNLKRVCDIYSLSPKTIRRRRDEFKKEIVVSSYDIDGGFINSFGL